MSRTLLDLVRELNTLNDDNLAERVIANNDVQWCLSELQDILETELPTLTPPNEALICDGCLWAEMGALEKCSSCMRDKKDNYYRRPPEGEEAAHD